MAADRLKVLTAIIDQGVIPVFYTADAQVAALGVSDRAHSAASSQAWRRTPPRRRTNTA